MSGLEGFLEMGGYARFVWPAYGLTLLVLILNVVVPVLRGRAQRRRLLRRYRSGTAA